MATSSELGIGPVMHHLFKSPEYFNLFKEVHSFLSFQGELNLKGMDISDAIFTQLAQNENSNFLSSTSIQANDTISQLQEICSKQIEKKEKLELIRSHLGECHRCKLMQHRTSINFGEGFEKSRLLFIGSAPNHEEDIYNSLFVGECGELFDKMILAMNLKRNQIYITNCVKCHTPNNRDPEQDEINSCQSFLKAQIFSIQPEVIVTFGQCAINTVLQKDMLLERARGKWFSFDSIAVMPTFHPMTLLRKPEDKKLVWYDLQQVMKRLGLTTPAK